MGNVDETLLAMKVRSELSGDFSSLRSTLARVAQDVGSLKHLYTKGESPTEKTFIQGYWQACIQHMVLVEQHPDIREAVIQQLAEKEWRQWVSSSVENQPSEK